jgi:acyl carrier protein
MIDEVASLVRQVTGETTVGPQTRLDGDLLMDSIEMTALSQLLHDRFGGPDLLAHLSELELDQIIALTVADVAEYVTGSGGYIASQREPA